METDTKRHRKTETAKMTKLLLLMESGDVSNFNRKTLDEIDVDLSTNFDNENQNSSIDIIPHSLPEESAINVPKHINIAQVDKVTKARKLIPWTSEQKEIANKFFDTHIKQCIPPKKRECVELKDKHPILFSNKDWLKIEVYIQNQYVKNKYKDL